MPLNKTYNTCNEKIARKFAVTDRNFYENKNENSDNNLTTRISKHLMQSKPF